MIQRKYSAIVFDLGNVLLPFDYKFMIDKLDKIKPGLGKYFFDTYFADYDFHRNYESGKISEEKFIERMLEILNHTIDTETFSKFFSEIFEENKEVTALLPELKRKYKLFLLSNTNSIHEKYGWNKCEFLNHFDSLIVSHKIGAVKPEEKIYRAVEKESGFPSEEHIFIDDVEEYVNAAKSLGWDGIQFKSNDYFFDELKKRNII